jgi:glycosyltransferase involved in cell wall biosynthesis
MSKSYVIISPCRDEAEYMERTLESVINQSLVPTKWIIVDDGSTDDTPQILERYAKQYPFIQIVTRQNRGFRKVGPGVIDAFYEGYESINPQDFEYVCKLDLDLDLPPRYFEILIEKMHQNPRIATCSGKPYNDINGKFVSEKRGDEMSVGMTKLYRMSAFIQIGGFVREVMWDAIDCHRCRHMGWLAYSWDEPDLRFNHLRMMGSSQHNILVGRMRHGFGQHFMGTGAVYMAATSIFRGMQRPFIIGGLAMFWGYLKSKFAKDTQLSAPELIKFINRYQWACLIYGKTKATTMFDEMQAKEWNPDRPALPMPLSYPTT